MGPRVDWMGVVVVGAIAVATGLILHSWARLPPWLAVVLGVGAGVGLPLSFALVFVAAESARARRGGVEAERRPPRRRGR